MERWSGNKLLRDELVPEVCGGGSLVVTLVAVRKGVHVRVVEKGFGAVPPRETLRVKNEQNTFVSCD